MIIDIKGTTKLLKGLMNLGGVLKIIEIVNIAEYVVVSGRVPTILT